MVLIVDFGSSKVPEIEKVIRELGYKGKVKRWDEEFDLTRVSGIVLSGAPVLLTKINPKPYLEKFSFLKSTNIPVLGICFGHQLLGLLNGATVFLGKENRTEKEIAFVNNSSLFTNLKNPSIFKEDHTEGINLPNDFICIANSDDYEVEGMQHISKKIFGVQFHPEVSGENGNILFENFLSNN